MKATREWSSIAIVKELGPDALDPVPAVAGDAVRGPLDLDQALDIEVHQVAGRGMLVTVGRQLRLQIADPVQLQPAQDPADGRRSELELLRDANPRPALAAQRFHLSNPFLGSLARAPMRPGRTIPESRQALHSVAPDPLGRRLPTEPALGCSLAQAQPPLHHVLR